MATEPTESSSGPRIVRGAVDSLSLYEITDYELGILEDGSPNSVQLNFAIGTVTMGLSFLATLLTVEIKSVHIFNTFVICTVIGIIVSAVLFSLWYRGRSKVSEVIIKIKARVPAAAITPKN